MMTVCHIGELSGGGNAVHQFAAVSGQDDVVHLDRRAVDGGRDTGDRQNGCAGRGSPMWRLQAAHVASR